MSDVNIDKLAMLSRLSFTAEEKATFGPKLDKVMDFVNKVSSADTSGVQPFTSAEADASTPERPDIPTEPNLREAFQQNAPKAEMGFYVVPKVVE